MKFKKWVWIGVIAAVAVILGLASFAVVPAGHSGVIVTMGSVNEGNILESGFHIKAPFVQQIVNINNQTVKTETEASAASKDLQTVSSTIAVNYHIDKPASASVYKNIGMGYDSVIIAPAIQESIKSVTARYTAEELITKRQQVSSEVREMLYERLTTYGIITDVFNIISFDFSPEFNAAVEAKQTAQQQALKAEQDLQRIEVEAKQRVTQAQAEAESIQLVQNALKLSPEYIEYIKWNKWDGKLPAVMTGTEGGGLILDVSDVTKSTPSTPESSDNTVQPTLEPTPEPMVEP
jgi:regulator of protease activity HflC (stomatin/prohibitin superfamily)